MKKSIIVFMFLTAFLPVFAQLSGDYYIPKGSQDKGFPTLAAAIDSLNRGEDPTGPVRFLIDQDLTEDASALIIHRAGLSAMNGLTIKPAPGKTPVVFMNNCLDDTLAADWCNAGLVIKKTSHVTIDGSNTENGTTRDLTFNLNDGTKGKYVLRVFGKSDSVVVKNAVFVSDAARPFTPKSMTAAILVSGGSNTSPDSLLIQNCSLGRETDNPLMGGLISIGDTTRTRPVVRLKVAGSDIFGTVTGIWLSYMGEISPESVLIVNNNISCRGESVNGYAISGIHLYKQCGNVSIRSNKFGNMKTGNKTGGRLTGIYSMQGGANPVLNICNNFFSLFECTKIEDNSTAVAAIELMGGEKANIYFNSIDVTPVAYTAAVVAGIIIEDSTEANIKDNIICTNYDSTNVYGIYFNSTGSLLSDNNLIHNSQSSQHTGYYNGQNCGTLAEWSALTGQDLNSKDCPVFFVSETDLHLAGSSIGDMNLSGTPVDGIAADIDGNARNSVTPSMGAVEASSSPLPVELSSFVCSLKTDGVLLSWNTATELNFLKFEIEKKSSASWIKIGEVGAQGNSNSKKSYSFTDASQSIVNVYYRLRILDLDGSSTYSPVLSFSGRLPEAYILEQNYPNPFNPSTRIGYSLAKASSVKIEIFDVLGRQVRLYDEGLRPQGRYEITVNANGLPSGTYIYRITASAVAGGNFTAVKKFSLLK